VKKKPQTVNMIAKIGYDFHVLVILIDLFIY